LPLEAFGSSTNSVRFTGDMGYVLAYGEALAEAALGGEARLEEGRVVDQLGTALLRGATPQWFAGRLVLYAGWTGRRQDTSATRVVLGGDNGLRGYDAGTFRVVGGSRLRTNVEYRTLPLVIESVHLGGVLFYDGGSVYAAVDEIEWQHAAGAGLRLLFPQLNHTPFRLDFGVPLDEGGFSVVVSYGSEQAIPLTAGEDAVAEGSEW
jgi:outer membrane translocation and assembly module TamA